MVVMKVKAQEEGLIMLGEITGPFARSCMISGGLTSLPLSGSDSN